MGIWDLIRKSACTDGTIKKPHKLYEVYLTRKTIHLPATIAPDSTGTHWVIGSYSELKRLASNMRTDKLLRDTFADAGAGYGRRSDDDPPTHKSRRPPGYRDAEKQATQNGTLNPVRPDLLDKRIDQSDRTPRRGDRFDPFVTFYERKTLEAHHIVEKSMFHTLDLAKNEFTDPCAPCVLVVAELHQQFYTPVVSPERKLITSGMANTDAAKTMREIYGVPEDKKKPDDPDPVPPPGGLYASPQMSALRDIAKVIIGRVEVGRTD